ncbi:hypothetical protein [Phenylobacterium sp.]|jgi:hypothetical protein|uniref:hypothetical protein n=1 Tax=Phenylobacterium sp. TaxID=1871053 RepID=UPI002F3F6A94
MTSLNPARVFKVDNKLARLARQPGGKTIDEAVRGAEHRIEAVRDQCVAALAIKAEQLATLAGGDRTGDVAELLERLYNLSNAIFGVAGVYGMEPLAEAACSLCDLLHGFRLGEKANWSAVDVHVDGIRLLANGREEGAASILAGLAQVRALFTPADL